MNQLTVQGFDDELRTRLQALAREQGVSMDQAALILMRRGAGLGTEEKEKDIRCGTNLKTEEKEKEIVGDALDEFIGSWTREEGAEFHRSIQAMEQIDPELWK